MSRDTWTNWAGNLHSDSRVATPKTLEDLCAAVRRAKGAGQRVRAAGGSYSWAPLVPLPNDDLIIRLDGLDKKMKFDEAAMTVEVECGVTVEELNREAAKRNLTIVSPTLYPKPTLGGAVAVGAHGTDFGHGGISDQVLGMTIVDANGDLRTIEADDPDLAAAKVALGTLGLVHTIKLQLVEQFDVATQIRILPVDRVLEEFDDLQASCDFLEMFWFPFSKTMAVYIMDRTTSPADPTTWWTRLTSDLKTEIQSVSAQKVIPWIAKNAPQATPILNSLATRMGFPPGFNVSPASAAFHFQKAYAKCWEMEYGVPSENAAEVWREGIDLVNHYAQSKLYPINLTLHGRFTGPSDCWIAPNHDRPTCYIDLTTAMGTPHWQSFFRELEKRWCGIEGARPHWGKMFFETDRVYDQYTMMDRFLEVRERWDPDRRFLNPYLEEQIFKLSGPSARRSPSPDEVVPRPRPESSGWRSVPPPA